jgi:hypothetical protein
MSNQSLDPNVLMVAFANIHDLDWMRFLLLVEPFVESVFRADFLKA